MDETKFTSPGLARRRTNRCRMGRARFYVGSCGRTHLMAQNLRPSTFKSSEMRPRKSAGRVLKMLNFFKNLFGSGAAETHANGNGKSYAPVAAPTAPVQVQARTLPDR